MTCLRCRLFRWHLPGGDHCFGNRRCRCYCVRIGRELRRIARNNNGASHRGPLPANGWGQELAGYFVTVLPSGERKSPVTNDLSWRHGGRGL